MLHLAAADAGFDRPAKQPERAGRRAAEPAGRAQADERIAIVGIGCRMPGGIDDPQGLWDLLDEGRDAVRLIERFDPAAADDYLALGYIPDPATIYRAIRRLPAAHHLLLRRGDQDQVFADVRSEEIRYGASMM